MYKFDSAKIVTVGYVAVFLILLSAACISIFTGDWIGIWYDTSSYFDAARSLSDGMIDRVRTPVYPAVIIMLRTLFGESNVGVGLQIIQWSLFIASVCVMRRTAESILGRGLWALTATALYGLNPAFWVYNDSILTESLSVSLTVFLLGAIISCLKKPNVSVVSGAWILLILLVFLRPALVCYIAVVAVWFLLFGKTAKQKVVSVAWLAVTGASILGYIVLMNHTYGISKITTVSSTNTFATLRLNGYISPSDYPDQYTRSVLDCVLTDTVPDIEAWGGENLSSMELLGPQGYDRMIGMAAAKYRTVIPECIYHRIRHDVGVYPLTEYNRYVWRYFRTSPPCPSILWGAYFLLIGGIAILSVMVIRKRMMPVAFLLCGLPAAMMFTSIAGAQGEFSRLFAPALPVLTLFVIYTVYKIVSGARLKMS